MGFGVWGLGLGFSDMYLAIIAMSRLMSMMLTNKNVSAVTTMATCVYVCVYVCVFVCLCRCVWKRESVYVCEREKERDRETERDRQTDKRHRHTIYIWKQK